MRILTDGLEDLIAEQQAELNRLWALLRMIRDEPSLARVKNVMGHDIIHGVIAVELRDHNQEAGPEYFDLLREQERGNRPK